jgi:voltage-gated potassium channel
MENISKQDRFHSIPYQSFALATSGLVLGILLFDSIGEPNAEVKRILIWTDYILCGMFLVDYVYNIAVAENRLRYVLTWGLIDIASCVPIFGWGRIARIIRVLKLLKGIKTLKEFIHSFWHRRGESALLTAFSFLIGGVLFGSIAILQCESPDGTLNNAADALWWTFCTMMKGGCENFDPVTTEGRLVAVVLSLLGLAINGTIIAFVASLMVNSTSD